ncbi:MAG: hypothetical protein ACWA47_04885 [Brevirhabdus sp.]
MKIDLNQEDRFVLKGTTQVIAFVLGAALLGLFAACLVLGFSGVLAGWAGAAAVVFMGGGILWLVYHKTEVVFDRPANSMTLRKTMLHGTREEIISLADVRQADVDLKRNERSNNRLRASYTYRLCLVVGTAQDRRRVPLSHGYTTSRRHLVTARKLNDWLGVPEAPIAAGPSMADVAEVIRSLGFGQAR